MCAAFHNALYQYPLRDTDALDVVLLQIYEGMCVPKIIKIQFGLTKLLQKNKMVQFFWLTVYIHCVPKTSHLYTVCNFVKYKPIFKNFPTATKRIKFATKPIRIYPSHLGMLVHQRWNRAKLTHPWPDPPGSTWPSDPATRPDPDKNIHYETTKQYAAWAQGPWLSAAAGSGEWKWHWGRKRRTI